MKRFIFLFAVCAVLVTGCRTYKDISVKSVSLARVTPVGLTAIRAEVDVELDNPTMGFTVKDVEGLVKMSGDSCLVVHADCIRIDRKSTKTYTVPLEGKLADGFNPFQLLSILSEKDLGVFTIDVKAKAVVAGKIGKEFEYHDIPLKQLIDKL